MYVRFPAFFLHACRIFLKFYSSSGLKRRAAVVPDPCLIHITYFTVRYNHCLQVRKSLKHRGASPCRPWHALSMYPNVVGLHN